MTTARRLLVPWLVFVSGALVGPILYWLIPPSPWFQYGLGPLLWPLQIWQPLLENSNIDNVAALVGLNVVLFAVVGMAIAAAALRPRTLIFAGTLLEVGVAALALAPAILGSRTLAGDHGEGAWILILALLFYGFLVFAVRVTYVRLRH